MDVSLVIQSTITIAVIYLFGCIGEILNEKVGHLNLGIPGIMSIGALGGIVGINIYLAIFGEVFSTIGILTMSILFTMILIKKIKK